MRETLLRLAILKTGCGLDTGASAIEIDAGEVQVAVVEPRFEARNFGTEPAGDITVRVNRDSNLTLLDDGMNLNRAERVGTNADMHLGVHLRSSGGIGRDRRHSRHCRGRGWSGVEHLVNLGRFGRSRGYGLGRGREEGSRGNR